MGGANREGAELDSASVLEEELPGAGGGGLGGVPGGGSQLVGELPPEEPRGAPAGGGGGGGRGGSLAEGLAEEDARSPVRGSAPFVMPEFDPIIYWLTIVDSRSKEHAAEYAGLSRSESVAHYLTRLAFEDFENKLASNEISGLVGQIGDRLLRVMRNVAQTAVDELHERVRADVISTLVTRGIATQERLEEVLGVQGSGIA